MFPQGGPGLALVLLRISVAATFLVSVATRHFVSSAHLLLAGVLLISTLLTIGCFTPLLSVLVCVSAVVNLAIGPRSESIVWAPLILNSAALAFLGPGAYSLDARLFGLRVMVLPPRKDDNQF
jgi:hypothetical protein